MMALPIVTILFAVFVLIIPVVIAVYVYRDAARRGMGALLWAVVAALAPSFIGLLIYLLVRGSYSDLRCPRCESPVTGQFVLCPRCGAKLKPICPNCAAPVEPDWKVCPKCAQPLPEAQSDYRQPVKAKDRSLGKVLAIVLIVPVLLFGLAVISFSAFSGGGATSFRECSFDEYQEEMNVQGAASAQTEVMNWLGEIRPSIKPDQAYALRYDHEESDEHYFLLYIPGSGNSQRSALGQSSGLFGTTVKLTLERTGNDGTLINVVSSAKKAPNLKIEVGGKKIPCDVTVVDYNPTVYHIFPQYNESMPSVTE